MRSIKFRGKLKEKGMSGWIEGSLVHITRTYKGEEDEQECNIYQIVNDDGVGFFIDKETIGQFTGLHDKNGKEIYEGDAWEDEDGFYIVVWDEERACFCVDIYGFDEWIGEGGQECYGNEIELLEREILYFWGDISKIEITKNIYENPELNV